MKTLVMITLFAVSSPAFGDTLSLVCEHDSGISIRTGLPDSVETAIFPIEFDLEKELIISPFFAKSQRSVGISPVNISWTLEVPSLGNYWQYKLNRYTGKLYLKRTAGTDTYMAEGRCVKPDPLF